jgi:endonuclease/exonuclease/phosphatase family metal-dependent hydrolase
MSRWNLHCALPLALILLGVVAPAWGAPPTLRVLTYNVHHCEGTDGKLDVERIAQVILAAKPDVVALQEVDVKAKRTGEVDQVARLRELTKMHAAFGAAIPLQGGEYGNAVLSRWPITESKNYALPKDPEGRSPEKRAVVTCRITPDNGLPELIFASTHLCHQVAAAREKQAAVLNETLSADPATAPVVLAGDFNALTPSASMQALLTKRWVDATAKVSKIDFVLLRTGDPWRVVEAVTLDEVVASDHRPVLAVLEWSK